MNIFLKTFIVTTVVFAIGVYLGYWLGNEKINTLERTTVDLQDSISEAELQLLLFDMENRNATCRYLSITIDSLIEETENLAKQVEISESSHKMNTGAFMELKQKYTLMLIKNWITMEKIKKSCHNGFVIVNYFYSNQECDKCEDQGIILSHIKQKLDQDIMIFAIDSNIGLRIVDSLVDSYNITSYPAIVIDGTIYQGYRNLDETTEIICSGNPELEIC